jgi:hypothetical protein
MNVIRKKREFRFSTTACPSTLFGPGPVEEEEEEKEEEE